ncbi:MAG: hypothetical protein AMXMBFR20_27820 [Planctomycetia bacterium]
MNTRQTRLGTVMAMVRMGMGMGVLGSAGCVAPHSGAGHDSDASISAVRTQVRDITNALASIESDLRAGGDISTNDAWTLRLLGLGVMLLGLSYPTGKILWLSIVALRQKAANLTGASGLPKEIGEIQDFLTLKERCADVVAHAGSPPRGALSR